MCAGDWARTHDERSALLFVAEREMVAKRRAAQRQRTHELLADLRRRIQVRLARS